MIITNDYDVVLDTEQLKDILRTSRDLGINWFNINSNNSSIEFYDSNDKKVLSIDVELRIKRNFYNE